MQTVRGKVSDKVTGIGLPGVVVQVKSVSPNKTAVTDIDGNYKLLEVPVGRQSFLFFFHGLSSRACK